MSRSWRGGDPVPERGAPRRPGDPVPVAGALDALLDGLGAPPVDAVVAVVERWDELAGPVLSAGGRPGGLEDGVLVVRISDPIWATEWRYRQGEVLRRCDDVLGDGVVSRIDVRVDR